MMRRLAEHTIALSLAQGKVVTVLPLSRILFFAIGLTIKQGTEEQVQFIRDRYDGDFERWRYGAVPPEVYFRYNMNGMRRLTRGGKYHEDLAFFDPILSKLLDADPIAMTRVNLNMASHDVWVGRVKKGAWVPNWTFEEIQYEFSQLRGEL